MSPLDLVHRVGELLEPCGHLRLGRYVGPGSVPSGPYVAQWRAQVRSIVASSAGASPDAAIVGLASELARALKVEVEILSRPMASMADQQLAEAYRMTLAEIDGEGTSKGAT